MVILHSAQDLCIVSKMWDEDTIISTLVEYSPAERWAEGRWVLNVWECLYCICALHECECVSCDPSCLLRGSGRRIALKVAQRCTHSVNVCSRERGRDVFVCIRGVCVEGQQLTHVFGVCVRVHACLCVGDRSQSAESQSLSCSCSSRPFCSLFSSPCLFSLILLLSHLFLLSSASIRGLW